MDTLRKNSQDGRFVPLLSFARIYICPLYIYIYIYNILITSLFINQAILINFVFILNRVRGKMRFWGKTKYGDKKTSREKLICGADSLDGDYGDTGPLLGESTLSKSKYSCLKVFHIIQVYTMEDVCTKILSLLNI